MEEHQCPLCGNKNIYLAIEENYYGCNRCHTFGTYSHETGYSNSKKIKDLITENKRLKEELENEKQKHRDFQEIVTGMIKAIDEKETILRTLIDIDIECLRHENERLRIKLENNHHA